MSELGNRLKEARMNKGMSLDDLQTVTKIQKRYLQGIEEGNYKMMPGSFYVRAFIKQYAEAVELEPEELFAQYQSEIPSTYNEEAPEQISRVQSRKVINPHQSKFLDLLPKILIGVIIIGVIATLYFFLIQKKSGNEGKEQPKNDNQPVTFEKSDKLKDKSKDNVQPPVTDETIKKEENTPIEPDGTGEQSQELTVLQSNGNKTVYELKNANDFQVKIVSTGETWVNVKNGKGYSFFQGLLKKGENESQTIDFSKEEEADIRVGRAFETEIYINDEKLEFKVSPTEVVSQDITIKRVNNETTNE